MFQSVAVVAVTSLLFCSPALAGDVESELLPRQNADLRGAQVGFDRYLSAWSGAADADSTVQSIFDKGAHIELTLSGRPEWMVRIDGTAAIVEYVESMRDLGGQWQFSNVQYYPTLQAGIVFAQFDAVGDGRSFRNMVAIELDDGRITRLRDFNAAPLLLQGVLNAGRSDAQPSRVARY